MLLIIVVSSYSGGGRGAVYKPMRHQQEKRCNGLVNRAPTTTLNSMFAKSLSSSDVVYGSIALGESEHQIGRVMRQYCCGWSLAISGAS